MKLLSNKFLTLVTCISALVLAGVTAHAQVSASSLVEEKNLPVGEFNALSVEDDFEVTLVKGAYSVRLTTDKVLAPYVQIYVRSKVLYITYDNKSVPKDVRKQFKGKNSSNPIFKVVVSLPELSGITLKENATLTSNEEFRGGAFEMNLQDKAKVKSLNISAESATLNMKKNTQAALVVTVAGKTEVTAEGNADLTMTAQTGELVVSSSNSANLAIGGECTDLKVVAAGSSKQALTQKCQNLAEFQLGGSCDIVISGEAQTLLLSSEKSAELDANSFPVRVVEATMGGGKATVNPLEEIHVTALTSGSALYFTGMPTFQIGKIVKSTLAPVGTK